MLTIEQFEKKRPLFKSLGITEAEVVNKDYQKLIFLIFGVNIGLMPHFREINCKIKDLTGDAQKNYVRTLSDARVKDELAKIEEEIESFKLREQNFKELIKYLETIIPQEILTKPIYEKDEENEKIPSLKEYLEECQSYSFSKSLDDGVILLKTGIKDRFFSQYNNHTHSFIATIAICIFTMSERSLFDPPSISKSIAIDLCRLSFIL